MMITFLTLTAVAGSMTDYLMAIPYDSDKNDYVSWGYWGKGSNFETITPLALG